MIPDGKAGPEPRKWGFVYHKSRVRRGFSILLVLFFALGPLTAFSSASEDAALPACCRRDGAHHCAMSVRTMAASLVVAPGAPPVAKTPSHCPFYPLYATVRTSPVHMLAGVAPDAAGLQVRAFAAPAGNCSPLLNPHGPAAVRGPPALPDA